MNRIVMITTQVTAVMPIGRDQRPRCHGPRRNSEPSRSRRNVGSTYATYRPMTAIDVTAAYAVLLPRYGRPRSSAPIAASQIALVGVRVRGLTLCQNALNGSAPSRENA